MRPLGVDVDAHEVRRRAEAGHPLHVAAEHDHEPRAGARHDAAHRQAEPARAVQQQRVVAERQVRLGHADRDRAEPELVHPREVLLGLRQVVDPVGAVELRRDRLDLLAQRRAVGRELVEGVRLLARLDDRLGELDRARRRPRRTRGSRRPSRRRRRPRARRSASISASVSVGKLLIETTHGRPYSRTISMCAARLSMPAPQRVEVLGRRGRRTPCRRATSSRAPW